MDEKNPTSVSTCISSNLGQEGAESLKSSVSKLSQTLDSNDADEKALNPANIELSVKIEEQLKYEVPLKEKKDPEQEDHKHGFKSAFDINAEVY